MTPNISYIPYTTLNALNISNLINSLPISIPHQNYFSNIQHNLHVNERLPHYAPWMQHNNFNISNHNNSDSFAYLFLITFYTS